MSMKVNTTYEPYSQEPEYIEANREMLKTLDLSRVKRVLDLACGTGLMTDLLTQLKPDIAVNGVDISAEQIGIGSRLFKEKGLFVADEAALQAALAAGKGAVMLREGSAMELPFADATFDMAMMGNAIHLMPDKDVFVQGLNRVLKPGAPFAFNSVFFTGTFGEGTEAVYTEWMKGAVNILMEMNEQRKRDGLPPIPRKRGKVGKAFDKDWRTPEEWGSLFEKFGFKIVRNYKRPVEISQRGLELVGAYGGLAEVLMSGYPVEIASECLQRAVGPAFEKMNVKHITRYWLEMTAVKQG